ncbi:MAG: tripartite tricarboxylate transporter TctB family protein [Gammaproteobacteria bacterium]|nr:tripartite tricarboxylate transporter TctB family protein [Gammaproteobacteria bacterium]MBU1441512.1 tripartite tricarboxylate transporter TctB family protein [Gammaproteobacteria bacterium]MBU2286305.1 tripartite tricarboxylate transporter TctB family protein [Gammaproteobacteria bacterium]
MKIKSQQNFYSGIMFAAVGAAFSIGATNYNLGEAARMGPGYFPLVLGALLCVLGLLVMLTGITVNTSDGQPIGKIAWKPLSLVIGANLLFGVLLGGIREFDIPAMGLMVAIYAMVIVACMAGPQFAMKRALILATILAIGSYLVFILGLGLQFQVWPTFIS